MKKIKSVASALVVLAVVGGALAFKTKAFFPGNIYCSDFAPISTELCSWQFTQPTNFQTAAIGSWGNPCISNQNPYINSGSSSCVELGSTRWIATQE